MKGEIAPVGEASLPRGKAGAPARAPAILETGPPCYLCGRRNMARVGVRVYFCQRCERGTLLTLHADGWRSYGVTLSHLEAQRARDRFVPLSWLRISRGA